MKTKQNNQNNNTNNGVDQFIKDAQKAGEQVWNQIQEWGKNLWDKFKNR